MELIELRGVNRYYGEGANRVHVLKDVNFTISKGEFVAIIGQSGSGKSTLMNTLGCLDVPSSGSYCINGTETLNMDSDQLAELRSRTFGFIFQRYNLLASLSAQDNVTLPSVYSGLDPHIRKQRGAELLDKLGLGDKLSSKPNELSGGQQQRVSIARALMNGGDIILADEPTGALDSKSGENVMAILRELNAAGHTIILVTHDIHIANYAKRIIEIKDGVIISDTVKEDETAAEKAAVARKTDDVLAACSRSRKDQFIESLKMSVAAIIAHKLRSVLTMLGIIIGIAAVVTVVALGRGSQERILADISSMGTNTITVYPGAGFGDMRSGKVKTLTVSDSDALGKQSYIVSSTPSTRTSSTLVYHNISLTAQLNGVGSQYFDVKGLVIDMGRFFSERDVIENSSVAVIDDNTYQKLFPTGGNAIGQFIIFDKKPLQIIGVTKKQDSVFGPTDSLNIWSPYTTVMNKFTGDRNISSIIVKIKDTVSSSIAEKNLTTLIRVKHGGKQDFFTLNTDSIKQTIESTTATMTILISCIALVSLVVGGIGVMNIMLVSVTERTREIGVRMAIGARQQDILEQFLIEAVLICIIGGFAGILFSFAIGVVFSVFITFFTLSYSTASIILALVCSTLIGIIFGFLPARNAARLNPIDALAYE